MVKFVIQAILFAAFLANKSRASAALCKYQLSYQVQRYLLLDLSEYISNDTDKVVSHTWR